MSIFTKIRNRTKWILSYPKSWFVRLIYGKPIVKSIEETILKVVNEKCSVSRYGDGEFNIMFENSIDFQQYDERLANKMKDILYYDDDKFLVCIAGEIYSCNKDTKKESKKFWKRYARNHHVELARLLKKGKVYYNASMTRFYMHLLDKTKSYHYAELLKKIWADREVVFVEGEKSRLGVGNDFFDNAKSIKRILCPANQAFDYYDEIIESIKNNVDKESLVLIALGPTATVMAYDLHLMGYQAIDIGHVDIEYEWMLMGAQTKVAVKNKYTNEAEDGKQIGDLVNQAYNNQILDRIGIDKE